MLIKDHANTDDSCQEIQSGDVKPVVPPKVAKRSIWEEEEEVIQVQLTLQKLTMSSS